MTDQERDLINGTPVNDADAVPGDPSADDVRDHLASTGGDPAQFEQLVRWVVEQLVDDTSQLEVTGVPHGSSVHVHVRVPEPEIGKIIGRGGRIAKSIRTALTIVGMREHTRVSLDIEAIQPE